MSRGSNVAAGGPRTPSLPVVCAIKTDHRHKHTGNQRQYIWRTVSQMTVCKVHLARLRDPRNMVRHPTEPKVRGSNPLGRVLLRTARISVHGLSAATRCASRVRHRASRLSASRRAGTRRPSSRGADPRRAGPRLVRLCNRPYVPSLEHYPVSRRPCRPEATRGLSRPA